MAFNPFRKHNRKAEELERLMKLNKPKAKKQDDDAANAAKFAAQLSNFLSTTPMLSQSMYAMQENVRKLNQFMSSVSIREILAAALNSWPMPLKIAMPNDQDDMYLDTEKYEFPVGMILELWNNFPIPDWIERHFNEAEPVDSQALYDYLARYTPESVMTLDMFMGIIIEYFNTKYQEPLAQTFSSFNGMTMEHKDYYLPGLKVLNLDEEGKFWSPVYHVTWEDNELEAHHHYNSYSMRPSIGTHEDITKAMGSCDCGIYASVNLRELWQYVNLTDSSAYQMGMDRRFQKYQRRLCIIEPFSDASVWIARKGWKASKAFISEIVGETISIPDAATLLSMVWQRPLDLSKLFNPLED